MPASPPDPPRAAGDDAVGPQVAVQPPIPLGQKLGMLTREVFEHSRFLGGSSLKSPPVNILADRVPAHPVFLAISKTLSPLAPQLAYMTLLGHADLSFPASFSGYVAPVKVAHRLGQHVPCGKCRLLADVYVDLDVTEYSSAGSAAASTPTPSWTASSTTPRG